MEQEQAFISVSSYTGGSIRRCHHLAEFIKKRQLIEEEYARSLRMTRYLHNLTFIGKLCKSVSLTPLQQQQNSKKNFSLFFWRKVQDSDKSVDPTLDSAQTYFHHLKSLFQTFI